MFKGKLRVTVGSTGEVRVRNMVSKEEGGDFDVRRARKGRRSGLGYGIDQTEQAAECSRAGKWSEDFL